MKLSTQIFSLLTFVAASGCAKGKLIPGPITAITVVNATVNSSPVIPVFGFGEIQWFGSAQTVGYGSDFEYSIPSGTIPISVYLSSDTTTSLFSGSFDLKPQGIYSLFLTGQIQGAHSGIDTLYTQDFPPYYPVSDSVAGVRFVNLFQGGNAVSVDLAGNAIGSEVAGLPYKGVSSFKAYSATSTISGYNFEVRDAITDSLLTTFSYGNMAIFKNVTVVIYGLANANSVAPIGCMLENNY